MPAARSAKKSPGPATDAGDVTAEKLPGAETPMLKQYWDLRRQLSADTLLLFRLGDFYELFFEDATQGARLLGLTLTHRNGHPMAGIPYHAAPNYIKKLLDAGRKVAVCDQTETPTPGKLVRRALTRVLTPGTILEDHQLEAGRPHYLLALAPERAGLRAAWLDLTTGDFQLAGDADPARLWPVLHALDPREILVAESLPENGPAPAGWGDAWASLRANRPVSRLPDFHFERAPGARLVKETLGVLNLEGFGISDAHPALGCAGALIAYATDTLCGRPAHLHQLREYRSREALLLDPATLRNLEVLRSARGAREGSLLHAVDATCTAPGARLLEQWLAAPLLDLVEWRRRQACVGAFLEEPGLAARAREGLGAVLDLARILSRLQNRLRHPREIAGVRDTLRALPEVRAALAALPAPAGELAGKIPPFDDLAQWLEISLAEEPPVDLKDGGVIRDGADGELDRLRDLSRGHKTWISDFQRGEQERTGIKNLRVCYNGAFGYYIEVTKSNLANVPADYIRRQTMTNAERYVTEELRQREKQILHAEENALAREEELFRGLVEAVLAEAGALRAAAAALAQADVFQGWAKIARERDYCRPALDDGDVFEIEQGRHPVVEVILRESAEGLAGSRAFVPNDTNLSASGEQIALITGPNMAGKSTYIRQVALIAILAQAGGWVPAKKCRLGLVDRVFSRIGASDELARGQSTFMVEMNETANILRHATARSLVVLDEIGRGTSTYDGLAIAWAVVERLHGPGAAGPRTLFATHYHELTLLEQSLPRLRNYAVTVKEWNDEIIFVRQVARGAAERSYGIQVARLAGLPREVIGRAQEILAELEAEGRALPAHVRKSLNAATQAAAAPAGNAPSAGTHSSGTGELAEPPAPQLELF
jgi:DNA mismatch repair protein MutS